MCLFHNRIILLVLVVVPHSKSQTLKLCKEPRIRKEWRELAISEREQFLGAVNCLIKKPSKYTEYFPVSHSRYDDFVALHVNSTQQSSVEWTNPDGTHGSFTPKVPGQKLGGPVGNFEHDDVHGSGSILPWHRYVISVYEDALVNECGWSGGMPYWNWHFDTPDGGGSWVESPLFHNIYGFGGDGIISSTGNGTAGCISDGPFSNHTLRIGPLGKMTHNNTRCLTRRFNSKAAESNASRKYLTRILESKTYAEFCLRISGAGWSALVPGIVPEAYGDLHSVGHSGLGGEMMDPFNSPNDPLFFLHHAMLDYLWTFWQEANSTRLADFSAQRGESYDAETELALGVFAPVRRAREVIDTQNRNNTGFLCYKYDGQPFDSN